LVAAISLIKLIVSEESLGLLERALDVCFQNTTKSSRGPREIRLRLNKEKCLLPGPNHCGHNDQEKPIGLAVCRSFDLARQNEQLVSQQGVFRQQFGFASRQIGKCAEHKGSRRWVDPPRNPFLERVKAQADWSPDGDEHSQQEWKRSFKNKARGSQEIGEERA
jgi:hypothetical protein